MAITAMTTKSSINVNALPGSAPRFCLRDSARLPASFRFMVVGQVNPDLAGCLRRAMPPNDECSRSGPMTWEKQPGGIPESAATIGSLKFAACSGSNITAIAQGHHGRFKDSGVCE